MIGAVHKSWSCRERATHGTRVRALPVITMMCMLTQLQEHRPAGVEVRCLDGLDTSNSRAIRRTEYAKRCRARFRKHAAQCFLLHSFDNPLQRNRNTYSLRHSLAQQTQSAQYKSCKRMRMRRQSGRRDSILCIWPQAHYRQRWTRPENGKPPAVFPRQVARQRESNY